MKTKVKNLFSKFVTTIIVLIVGAMIIDKVHYNKLCYPNKLKMFFYHPYLSLRYRLKKSKY